MLTVAEISYCSRSQLHRFIVFHFKRWAFSHICGHFQQNFYSGCAETVICELAVKFLTPSFDSRPRFLYRVRSFDYLATISVDFFHFICWTSAIFLLSVCWPTDLESVRHASTPMEIISTKCEVDMTILFGVIECFIRWYVTWPCVLDLWPLTFWHWAVVVHGGSRFLWPVRSWVISYNVFHRIPLTLRFWLLHMRRITWPVRRRWMLSEYLKSTTSICLDDLNDLLHSISTTSICRIVLEKLRI